MGQVVQPRRGTAGKTGRDAVRRGHGEAWVGWFGEARHGGTGMADARHDEPWYGGAWLGRFGLARQARGGTRLGRRGCTRRVVA